MLTRHVEKGAETDMVVKRSWHQQFSTFNSSLEQITKCYHLSLLPLVLSFPMPPFMQVSCMIMNLSNHFGGRYVALMKLILPRDGHLTSHGRIRCWKVTDSQKMEELNACESLLVIFSNLLGKQ